MFLTYGDLAKLFPQKRGIQLQELFFHTVATSSNTAQYKGIYIPLAEHSGELKKAIENGAIAALWDENVEIPLYTPNHFPLFLTNDLLKGLKDMMELYIEKINATNNKEDERTNFFFLKESCLKENTSTYDIAVNLEKIVKMNGWLQQGREGAK